MSTPSPVRIDRRTVSLLAEVAELAAQGGIQDFLIVYKDGEGEYGCVYQSGDLPDMLCEVRGHVIRVQASMGRQNEGR